jgi:hypothetical protein
MQILSIPNSRIYLLLFSLKISISFQHSNNFFLILFQGLAVELFIFLDLNLQLIIIYLFQPITKLVQIYLFVNFFILFELKFILFHLLLIFLRNKFQWNLCSMHLVLGILIEHILGFVKSILDFKFDTLWSDLSDSPV